MSERGALDRESRTVRLAGPVSLGLGLLSLGAVLCFRFPAWLTTPELRAHYPLDLLRAVLFVALVVALLSGLVAVLAGVRRRLGWGGLASSGAAVALGGAWVEAGPVSPRSPHLGLDWFLLDLLVLALVFVPLERGLALVRAQTLLRTGWKTDLAHFFASHLLVQVTSFLTLAPAALLFADLVSPRFQARVAALPFAVQLGLAVLLADLFQYAVHRAMHAVPLLWRFHAIHHSITALDWLAGSRLHLVDVVLTRAVSFVPLFVMGFAPGPLTAYLVWVAFQATLLHANVRLPLRPLRWVLATPCFHHWHHAAEPEARDRNFAVHLPVIDLLFGTAYLPDRFPRRYGVVDEHVPEGWWRQLAWPFRRRPSRMPPA